MPVINPRERRVDLWGTDGAPLAVHVAAVAEPAITPTSVVAVVVAADGTTVTTFARVASPGAVTMWLTAEQTRLIGSVRARWYMTVEGRPWLGGAVDLASPGVRPATSPWSPPVTWDLGDVVLTVTAELEDPPVPPTITTAALDAMTEGTPFEQTLTATSALPVTWAITEGGIGGLVLSSAGVLSGTPTTPGPYTITISASNAAGETEHDYSGTVEPEAVVFDSFVTTATAGPTPWWEEGPGTFVQEWTPPYANGVQFRAVSAVLVHGARWWRPVYNETPPAGIAPELRLSLAGGGQPILTSVAVTPAEPPAVASAWQTVMFAEPYEVAADTELCLWIASLVGGTTALARQADYFPEPVTSPLGLIESIDPSGRFATPFAIDQDFTPWGEVATVWYWIDPIVSAA